MKAFSVNPYSRIDFVGVDSADRWLLILTEQGPWSPPYTHRLSKLQLRLYDCIDAALDGAVAARFPESLGKRVAVVVFASGLPRSPTEAFFNRFVSGVWAIPAYAEALRTRDFVSAIDLEIVFDRLH
jgi:hypothetical protein